jgi:predicted pyridoxine 5'-phosphate oxidase superfamily flavin-nucleotide-binding protein
MRRRATRRRLRLNGRFERDREGRIVVHADEVYSNCPKYIQRREGEREAVARPPAEARRTSALDDAQRAWIRRADTFFVASHHPEAGADASHRGGMPGFVEVHGNRLTWPDYAGNAMFNTLGNIAANPRAGIVVPDFDAGAALQLTGRAAIVWDPERARSFPGAQRLVELLVEEVVETRGAIPLALRLREYSPVNPPAPPGVGTERGRAALPGESRPDVQRPERES